MTTTNKKVKMELVGIDGNAFAILGAFNRAALKQKWTREEVQTVIDEATSSDYSHLIATIANHVESPDEE